MHRVSCGYVIFELPSLWEPVAQYYLLVEGEKTTVCSHLSLRPRDRAICARSLARSLAFDYAMRPARHRRTRFVVFINPYHIVDRILRSLLSTMLNLTVKLLTVSFRWDRSLARKKSEERECNLRVGESGCILERWASFTEFSFNAVGSRRAKESYECQSYASIAPRSSSFPSKTVARVSLQRKPIERENE